MYTNQVQPEEFSTNTYIKIMKKFKDIDQTPETDVQVTELNYNEN